MSQITEKSKMFSTASSIECHTDAGFLVTGLCDMGEVDVEFDGGLGFARGSVGKGTAHQTIVYSF
jgi:hypothetical protein